MALVQYPQITGDGLGSALRPPLRIGAIAAGVGNEAGGKPAEAHWGDRLRGVGFLESLPPGLRPTAESDG